jgi:hypothetical protein
MGDKKTQSNSRRPALRFAARIGSTQAASEKALLSGISKMPTKSGAVEGAKMVF